MLVAVGETVPAGVPAAPSIEAPPRDAPPTAAVAEEEEMKAAALRGRRILVVDDEEDVRIFLTTLLEDAGADVLTASDGDEAIRVAAEEKPVVVSMVNVAASGGYMIAYRGSRIVADRSTVTGSIGSISGKFNIKGFHDKIGFTHDFLEKGPMGLLFSDQRDFTEEEWESIRRLAYEANITYADVMRRAIQEYLGLKKQEQPRGPKRPRR